jgi:hypothetical protein
MTPTLATPPTTWCSPAGNVSGLNFAPSDMFGTSTVQSLTLSRNVTLAEAGGGLSAQLNNTTLTVSGQISGPGRLLTGTGFLGNTGVLKLTNSNTYSGATVIFGNVAITSDAALGTNSEVVGTGGFLRADGPVTSGRNFTLSGSMPFITNGFDMTLNGTISNQAATPGTISKGGTNTLTLTGNSQFNGALQVGLATPLGDMGRLETGGALVLSGAQRRHDRGDHRQCLFGRHAPTGQHERQQQQPSQRERAHRRRNLRLPRQRGTASTETIGTLTAANFSPAVANASGLSTSLRARASRRS